MAMVKSIFYMFKGDYRCLGVWGFRSPRFVSEKRIFSGGSAALDSRSPGPKSIDACNMRFVCLFSLIFLHPKTQKI